MNTVALKKYPSYNPTVYSAPWVAKLSYCTNLDCLSFTFVDGFAGDSKSGGELKCELSDGDYIAYGQTDYTGNKTTLWLGRYEDGCFTEMEQPEILKKLKKG